MTAPVLRKFGETLIREVRDEALDAVASITDGRAKAPDLQQLVTTLKLLPDSHRKCAIELAYQAINVALFSLLRSAEEGKIHFTLRQDTHGDDPAELSDGLAGELYGRNGWIAQFSKYPENPVH
jgi:hypothetical protein